MTSGRNSVVECQLPKLDVVGSNPIARFWFMGHLYHLIIEGLGWRADADGPVQ